MTWREPEDGPNPWRHYEPRGEADALAPRYVSASLSRSLAASEPSPVYSAKFAAANFWPRVDKSGGPYACWEWQGPTDKDGYGLFKPIYGQGSSYHAHRYALEVTIGKQNTDVFACHACNNPTCVNPNPGHVYAGNSKTNGADLAAWNEKLATILGMMRSGASLDHASRACGTNTHIVSKHAARFPRFRAQLDAAPTGKPATLWAVAVAESERSISPNRP